jgi:uncharacterized protein
MLKRLALIVTGWTLLILGLAGLFLPVLPGVALLIIALSILSVEYEWARRWVLALKRRFPSADKMIAAFLRRHERPTSA